MNKLKYLMDERREYFKEMKTFRQKRIVLQHGLKDKVVIKTHGLRVNE